MITSFSQRYSEHWRRTLIGVVMLAVTAIGVYWNATIAVGIAVVCLVVGGARAIASVAPAQSVDPAQGQAHGDQAWAREILARSLLAETLFTSFEFLTPIGVTLMIVWPLEIFLGSLWVLFWVVPAAIAVAFAMVVWERHTARKTLRLRSN